MSPILGIVTASILEKERFAKSTLHYCCIIICPEFKTNSKPDDPEELLIIDSLQARIASHSLRRHHQMNYLKAAEQVSRACLDGIRSHVRPSANKRTIGHKLSRPHCYPERASSLAYFLSFAALLVSCYKNVCRVFVPGFFRRDVHLSEWGVFEGKIRGGCISTSHMRRMRDSRPRNPVRDPTVKRFSGAYLGGQRLEVPLEKMDEEPRLKGWLMKCEIRKGRSVWEPDRRSPKPQGILQMRSTSVFRSLLQSCTSGWAVFGSS